jgi:PAS domain-containing protein
MAVVFEEPVGGARQADAHELDTSQYRGNPEPFPSGQGDENLRAMLAKQKAEAADRKRLRDLKAQPAVPRPEADERTANEEFDLADLLDGDQAIDDETDEDLDVAVRDELALQKAKPEVKKLARQSADAGFKNLRKESINRRESGKRIFGSFLIVREGNVIENRGDKIVIQDGRTQVTTRITPIPGVLPEDHEGALEELAKYIRRSNHREMVKADPEAIPLDRLFKAYHCTRKPEMGCAGYKTKLESYNRDRAANFWLIAFGVGKTIRYVDDDFGRHYKRWRLRQTARVKRKYERRDEAIEKEQRLAERTFKWLNKKLRKAGVLGPDTSFEIQRAPEKQKKSLTWLEFEWLLLACRGFQREGYSYKKKVETRHGVEREVWDRLDDSQTKWLIRFFETYFGTGTRFVRNKRLLWGLNDGVGSLDRDGRAIWRNGRLEELNGRKIAGRSPLVPVFAAKVRKWFRQDKAWSKKWGFEPLFVIHDQDGNPLQNIENLVTEVFRRAGLENSAHIIKHTLVTLYALAGATSDEIAEQTNTDRSTLEKTYKWLPFFENMLERRNGRHEITRLVDIKRASPQPILPEIAAEAVAKLNGGLRCRS